MYAQSNNREVKGTKSHTLRLQNEVPEGSGEKTINKIWGQEQFWTQDNKDQLYIETKKAVHFTICSISISLII